MSEVKGLAARNGRAWCYPADMFVVTGLLTNEPR